jgi:alpha-galactosidase
MQIFLDTRRSSMRRRVLLVAIILICFGNSITTFGASDANRFDLLKVVTETPFSFVYGGRTSQDLIGSWQKTQTTKTLPDGRKQVLVSFRDPKTHLHISSETTFFANHRAADWLLYFQNEGTSDTPIIQDLRPMDLRVPLPAEESATFHYVLGSALRPVRQTPRPKQDAFPCPDCSGADTGEGLSRDYLPLDDPLRPGDNLEFSHYVLENGKHTESYLPFFNVQWSRGGLVGAIGWTGQWMVKCQRNGSEFRLQMGQQATHFVLHPGERIRTPRMLLIEWQGSDRFIGQNELRQLLVAYYLPRVNGKIAMPPVAHTGAYVLIFDDIARKTGRNPLTILPTLQQSDLDGKSHFADPNAALNYVTAQNQLSLIRGLPKVGVEAYWLDAGWFEGLWPGGRGSWVPNKSFPDGLRPLGDAAHQAGMKFLLWFDPEGVARGSLIEKEHPEWVLHRPEEGLWGGIFRFSDPVAVKWIADLISERIRNWGIDIFRNDRNTNPLPFWQIADAPDRQGITEIKQIEGLYTFWDTLRERFPAIEIDNANWRVTGPDLETTSRSVGSLTRSEITSGGIPHAAADQAETAELSMWVPLHSNILHGAYGYDFRSTATTGVAIALDLQSPYVPVNDLRQGIAELKELRPYWLGDYYPLMPINLSESTWCGWQFHREDLKAGFAMLFRRKNNAEATKVVGLHGLDPKARYEITFQEEYGPSWKQVLEGSRMIALNVTISSPGKSLLIRYRKTGAQAKASETENFVEQSLDQTSSGEKVLALLPRPQK